MRSVETSAPTRKEAIDKALQELGAEMHDVENIEVLDEGSKGLFGFGSRPVKVRVTADVADPKPARRSARPERDTSGGDSAGERPERGSRGGRGGRNRKRDESGEARTEAPRAERNGDGAEDEAREGGREGRRRRRGGRNRNRGRGGEDRAQDGARAESGNRRNREDAGNGDRPARPPRREREREHGVEQDRETFAPISDEQGREAAAILQEIITKMGMEATVEFARVDDGAARLNVTSEDGGILIGRKGRTLSDLQYLINRIISQTDTAENSERLVVDIEGYLDRRKEMLEEMAREFAAKAKDTGRNMKLKPMSPQERRIVHVALADDEEIRTFSLGDSLYRCVVIGPKNGGSDDRPRRGGGRRGPRREAPSPYDSESDGQDNNAEAASDASNGEREDRPQRPRRRGGRRRGGGLRSGGRATASRSASKDTDADAGTFGD